MNPPVSITAEAPRRSLFHAIVSLFALTLRQELRGKRLLILSLTFLLPTVLIVTINITSKDQPPAGALLFGIVNNLIPHSLLPLTALLYSAGLVRDEVEERTLTYLLLRPIPRSMTYLVKWAATVTTTATITTVFTAVAFAAVYLTSKNPPTDGFWIPAAKTVALFAVAQGAYCSLFGLIGVVTKRSLIVGVAYIGLIEGALASLDTIARKLTITYQLRVVEIHWLSPKLAEEWGIDMSKAPELQTCVLTLLAASVVLAVATACIFSLSEFRIRSSEGA